jgi:pimeloyl-ACP methyl ester carboxylesterase
VQFLGGTPQEVPQNCVKASPIELKISCPQAVIVGDKDEDVPREMTREYARKKKAAGENVALIEIPGADHFDLIDPRAEAFQIVLRTVRMMCGA